MFRKACAIALFSTVLSLTGPVLAAEGDSVSVTDRFIPADTPAPPPDFVFQDANGKSLRLADFRGRAVVLNIWASWCDPCIAEMPSLDRLQTQIGANRLLVIPLDVERGSNADVAANFFKRHDIRNLGIYVDSTGRIGSALHLRGLPTTLLIDRNGREVGSVSGGVDWDAPESINFLRNKLLD